MCLHWIISLVSAHIRYALAKSGLQHRTNELVNCEFPTISLIDQLTQIHNFSIIIASHRRAAIVICRPLVALRIWILHFSALHEYALTSRFALPLAAAVTYAALFASLLKYFADLLESRGGIGKKILIMNNELSDVRREKWGVMWGGADWFNHVLSSVCSHGNFSRSRISAWRSVCVLMSLEGAGGTRRVEYDVCWKSNYEEAVKPSVLKHHCALLRDDADYSSKRLLFPLYLMNQRIAESGYNEFY